MPVTPSNPLTPYHAEATQLYNYLATTTHPVEVRRVLVAVCALLVKMTADAQTSVLLQ